MADDISAEEQRQIDAAIALSLGQQSDSTSTTAAGKQQARQVINIDDSSSDNEGITSRQAARKDSSARISKSINDTGTETIDNSATEESSDEEASSAKASIVKNKRKLGSSDEEDHNDNKKPKTSGAASPTKTTGKSGVYTHA